MTLPNSTCLIEEDPSTYEDLNEQGGQHFPSCPYCGARARDHSRDDNTPEHEHRDLNNHRICRRLYACVLAGNTNLFYAYIELDTANSSVPTHKWAVAKVTEKTNESVDDPEVITFSRKKLAEPVKPTWRFKTSLATKEDWTEYFAQNLVIGLELELDWKSGIEQTNSVMEREFGVCPTEYHCIPNCPICGSELCWKHSPANLIRSIEHDGSIEGWEFLIYGNKLSSEEFAKRVPLDKFKKYFEVSEADSLHVHAMLVHDIRQIPNVIAKNLWQLFRFYYPAWVYLFGNHSPSTGFLRNNSFAHFAKFSRSPFMPRWDNDLNAHDNSGARSALYFGSTPIRNPKMDAFDIEIRTPDATLDLEQIVAARALTRALVLRAAQLSNYGLLSVETNEKDWAMVKNAVSKLDSRSGITEADLIFVKAHAVRLVKELSPFLSEFERRCIKSLFDKPVRERTTTEMATEIIVPQVSELAKQLKRLITVADIEASTKGDWIKKVAVLMGTEPSKIVKALGEIKAYFDDSETKMQVNS